MLLTTTVMKRPAVDFLIIGAQKAGTTAAAFNLNQHPDVGVFSGITQFHQHEIEFFTQHWDQGLSWYATHFDYSRLLVGEKTAELFHRKIAHGRMFEALPNAKLILLLRCPVKRAYSQWNMATRPKWGEHRTFREAVESELTILEHPNYREHIYQCRDDTIQPWRQGYLLKGFYVEPLEHLLRFFPRRQIHIAISERVRQNMELEYNAMFRFLGVCEINGHFEERFRSRSVREMDDDIREVLRSLYKPYNERLFALLGSAVCEWD
jgi:Sulfotransferase domain